MSPDNSAEPSSGITRDAEADKASDDESLGGSRKALDALLGEQEPPASYSLLILVFVCNEIGYQILSIVVAEMLATTNYKPDMSHDTSADRIAELCLQQVEICFHLQRWLDAPCPLSHVAKMFANGRLIKVNDEPPDVLKEACRKVCQKFPSFKEAYEAVAGYAGLDGRARPQRERAEKQPDPLCEQHFWTITDVAFGLRRARMETFLPH